MSGSVSFIAWRLGKSSFGLWHQTRDNKFSLCGKTPAPMLSVWKGKDPPPMETQCQSCRLVESRELRNR